MMSTSSTTVATTAAMRPMFTSTSADGSEGVVICTDVELIVIGCVVEGVGRLGVVVSGRIVVISGSTKAEWKVLS